MRNNCCLFLPWSRGFWHLVRGLLQGRFGIFTSKFLLRTNALCGLNLTPSLLVFFSVFACKTARWVLTVCFPFTAQLVFLLSDRYVEFHSQHGRYYKTRIPKFGRDISYHYPSCDLYFVGARWETVQIRDLSPSCFIFLTHRLHDCFCPHLQFGGVQAESGTGTFPQLTADGCCVSTTSVTSFLFFFIL